MSFFKITTPDPVTKKQRFNTYYTTYMWQASDDTYTMADPVNTAPVLPAGLGPPYKIPGSTWVDANGNRKKDDARLIRVDPNPDATGHYAPVKILSNYVKGTYVDSTGATVTGFQVRETLRTVNGNKQIQCRLTLVLNYTDVKNRIVEQTLETNVFLRNSQ